MILTCNEIKKQIKRGNIGIEPFSTQMLNPNSYNYRLNKELLVIDNTIDSKSETTFKKITIPEQGYVLQPGILYLASTVEKIGSKKYVTLLIGRSSIGRLGMFLQITAPLGHIGTFHNWTLEIKVVQPVKVYPYMKIGQVTFWKVKGNKNINYQFGDYKKFESAQISKFYKELS